MSMLSRKKHCRRRKEQKRQNMQNTLEVQCKFKPKALRASPALRHDHDNVHDSTITCKVNAYGIGDAPTSVAPLPLI